MSPVEWRPSAEALGLAPAALRASPAAGFAGASFPTLKRALGPVGPGTAERAMLGARSGVEVAVVLEEGPTGVATHVVARVRPDLGVGLYAATRGPWPPPLGGVRLRDPVASGALVASARDAASAELLLEALPAGYAAEALALGPSVLVTDGVVTISVQGYETRADALAPRLDAAVGLARALAGARSSVGPSRDQAAALDAWREPAERAGLALSSPDVRAHGTPRGCELTLAHEPEPGQVFTAIKARFPTSLGWGLAVVRQVRGPLEAMFAPLAPLLGDPAFDSLLAVRSYDPTPRSRLALDHPMRHALTELAARSAELQIDDEGLFVRVPSPLASPYDAAFVFGATQLVAFHLAGLPRPGGPRAPYR